MAFADSAEFKRRILDAPPRLPAALLERSQRIWLDDGEIACGQGWAHSEPLAVDINVHWQTEFGTDRILAAIEDCIQGELFDAELKSVPPGLSRGFAFETVAFKPDAVRPVPVEAAPPQKERRPAVGSEAPGGAPVEGVDSISVDAQSGFTFVRHQAREPAATASWARPVDAHHVPLDFEQVVPKYAFEYPFELDPFQKQAVYHLEKNESVFVAAHTSAGKTVVAEYAIALAQKHLTKAIYTSPIKALSNQKFRDFRETFADVGLLTGDVQLNQEAPCLIMTTEILRSMLYRGADLIRDVEFVIFDEVHYVNDSERGVVWEEVIIMLPPHVTLIMLSATIPNTLEFADWVGRTKQKEIYVISTLKRPVPLEHFLYVRKEPVRIVDAAKQFLEQGLREAQAQTKGPTVAAGAVAARNSQGGIFRGSKQEHSLWIEVSSMLKRKALLPAVVFTFSKRKCEENAEGMASLDFNGPTERSAVHLFLKASLQRLKGTDSQLPQILRMREMLGRGIAVHHSGLLPIMKEAVEILFSRGLIKMLFATETFAMGVNMPARTVVFSSIRKHDGTGFRTLLPGEYTQMAGRAGRRGLDPTGVVIIACPDEVPAEVSLRTMLLGQPTKLTSQFRLTYTMILNLLRVQALRMEEMIKKSFSENSAQRSQPADRQQIDRHEAELQALRPLDCGVCQPDLAEFYTAATGALAAGVPVYDWLLNGSKQATKYFEAGRIAIVNTAFLRNVPGVILRVNSEAQADRTVAVFVLRPPQAAASEADLPLPPTMVTVPAADAAYDLVDVAPAELVMVCKERLRLDFAVQPSLRLQHPKDLVALQAQLLDLAQRTPAFTEIDLPASRQLDIDEKRLVHRALLEQARRCQCVRCPDLLEHYRQHHQHQALVERLAELRFKLSDANMLLLPEYQARVAVLKTLNYIDANSHVQLKGRVASEINTTDGLITSELLFANVFLDYEPAEIIALLSCMVFQEKHAEAPPLAGRLLAGQERILETAKNLVTLQREHGVDIAMDQVLGSLNFGLVQVVYEWARGKPFKQITELTNVLEGSIVRCIVRLDETCRELRGAAKIMGDPTFHKKMEEASNMIKRDICFASSLYY